MSSELATHNKGVQGSLDSIVARRQEDDELETKVIHQTSHIVVGIVIPVFGVVQTSHVCYFFTLCSRLWFVLACFSSFRFSLFGGGSRLGNFHR